MQELCEKDAGLHIYERIQNVEGYAVLPGQDNRSGHKSLSVSEIASGQASSLMISGGCFPCFEELVGNGYRFIETYFVLPEGVPTDWRGDNHYVHETGLYRYQLVNRAEHADLCEAFDRILEGAKPPASYPRLGYKLQGFWQDYQKYKSKLGDQCIVVNKINEYSAGYFIQTSIDTYKIYLFEGNRHKIIRHRVSIFHKNGDNILTKKIILISKV